jgi:hypothetical protein
VVLRWKEINIYEIDICGESKAGLSRWSAMLEEASRETWP